MKLAVLDPNYSDAANTALQENAPPPVQYTESRYTSAYNDPRTVLIDVDRTTNRQATEFTPPENIVQRRVYIEQLPAYAPDDSPAPLTDEKADPAAVKAVRNQNAVPQIPEPKSAAPQPAKP